MLKDQGLAAQVLDALYTLQEAAIDLLRCMDEKDRQGFERDIFDIAHLVDVIMPHAIAFVQEEPRVSLMATCQCIKATIADVRRFYGLDMMRCRSKIQFELLPLAEAEYDLFYYWGIVYPDPERMKKYYDEEYIPLNINRYTEQAVQTGSYKYKVSIVVQAYNHLEITKQCVQSLLSNLPTSFSYELILMNHGSTDGTKTFFESVHPTKQVDFAVNSASSLICSVRNRIAEGEYLLWISNDVFVTPNAIENLVACMDSDPKIAWAVPATPNVSNYQSIPANYHSLEELYAFCKKNNQRNPRKWEQRVRLCNPIDIMRCETRLSSKGIGYLKPQIEDSQSFPDDMVALYLRRNGYGLRLVKDAYCHHVGSVTINNNPDFAKKQDEYYLNGRIKFFKQFGVDPWGVGMCYSRIFMKCVIDPDMTEAEILGINCGLGSNSLKIKDQLKEYCGNCNTHLFNVTDDNRYLADLAGISERAVCITNMAGFEEFLSSRQIRYLIWEEPFLVEENFGQLWSICKRVLLANKGVAFVKQNTENAAFLSSHGEMLGEDWYRIKF